MENNGLDWVDERDAEIKEEKAKGYFDIKEGTQQFILLSHCARLAQVFDPATKKYRTAEEGDSNISVKGLCWVLQDGLVKQAKLPYTIVKSIRALQQNPDWEFVIPFPHMFTLNAVDAGTKEVVYTLTASPKKTEIPAAVLTELSKKPTPEEIVEKIKSGKSSPQQNVEDARKLPPIEYPTADINPDDIPF